MDLADRIRARMSELDLTQETVAELAGISQAMVYKLLSRNARNTTKIVELANALECEVEWLATGTSNRYKVQEDGVQYSYTKKLSAKELTQQLKALPKAQQKKIAMSILDDLV